jgi:hypothetical protein
LCRENLSAAKQQVPNSTQFAGMENTTSFGVAGRRQQSPADVEKHTDQVMFSCGSLAPKLRAGGCSDHSFVRTKEPWEASDGATFLLRELASVRPDLVEKKLPELAELAALRHFEHAHKLRATLWNCLPIIARRLGKKAYRFHADLFVDAMFDDLVCGQQLTETAAGTCVAAFRDWFGATVFAGHLSEQQKAALISNSNIPVTLVWQEDRKDNAENAKKGAEVGAAAEDVRGSVGKYKPLAERMQDMPPGTIPNLLGC